MAYAPEQAYADENGTNRRWDEMWTGDWWWKTQVLIMLLTCCRIFELTYFGFFRSFYQVVLP